MSKPSTDKIPVTTFYRTEFSFDGEVLEDEDEVERKLLGIFPRSPDRADFDYTAGSPASSPMITVTGTSRLGVVSLTRRLVKVVETTRGKLR